MNQDFRTRWHNTATSRSEQLVKRHDC